MRYRTESCRTYRTGTSVAGNNDAYNLAISHHHHHEEHLQKRSYTQFLLPFQSSEPSHCKKNESILQFDGYQNIHCTPRLIVKKHVNQMPLTVSNAWRPAAGNSNQTSSEKNLLRQTTHVRAYIDTGTRRVRRTLPQLRLRYLSHFQQSIRGQHHHIRSHVFPLRSAMLQRSDPATSSPTGAR